MEEKKNKKRSSLAIMRDKYNKLKKNFDHYYDRTQLLRNKYELSIEKCEDKNIKSFIIRFEFKVKGDEKIYEHCEIVDGVTAEAAWNEIKWQYYKQHDTDYRSKDFWVKEVIVIQ